MRFVAKTAVHVIVTDGRTKFVLPLVACDDRRSIYEAPFGAGVLQYYSITAAHLPLGKHFHQHKTETFTLLSGGGYVVTSMVNGCGQPIDYEGEVLEPSYALFFRQQLSVGSVAFILPFVAHTFYLDPGSEMCCLTSLPFDQNDMFSTPWLVMEPAAADN